MSDRTRTASKSVRRVLLAASFFLAAAGAPCLARPLDDVVASGMIRIAVYSENKPWSEKDKDGTLSGIDIDLARAIAEKLKVKPEIVVYDASEDVGGDFRLNLWKGDLVGSPLSDLMLQVPNDRVLTLRDDQVFLTAPYFMQKLAFAYHGDKGKMDSVSDIGTSKVAVEGTSASDIALMTVLGGRFRPNAAHFVHFEEAVKAYKSGEDPVIAGTQAQIQAAFHENNIPAAENPIMTPSLMGPVKNHWELAGAVRANSRDLGYAVGDIITAMIKDGRMKAICDKYGVTFTPPDM